MSIPEFQDFMLPILLIFEDKNIHTISDCINKMISFYNLTQEDVNVLVPSGRQTRLSNRVSWSLTYLKKSLLLDKVGRGKYKITLRGIELLNSKPKKIDRKLLSQFEEFRDFSNQHINDNMLRFKDKEDELTPEDRIDFIYKSINSQLSEELLEFILEKKDSYYFERLVIDVLTKVGYGVADYNFVTKKSRDGGIDGIINQDRLGLDKIYVQAKMWSDVNVSRPELQKFVGALSAKKSNKGIFITLSDFTDDAKDYALDSTYNLVLINGMEFAKLMIEYNIGVQVSYSYEIKKVDRDYFETI